jgi:hypothetical protein
MYETLQIPIEAGFTDSLINLSWMKNGGDAYKIWVGNCKNKITSLTPADLRHFCPGSMNPADLDLMDLMDRFDGFKTVVDRT